jgi:hypothetical protein
VIAHCVPVRQIYGPVFQTDKFFFQIKDKGAIFLPSGSRSAVLSLAQITF